jgi:hypothetical protein
MAAGSGVKLKPGTGTSANPGREPTVLERQVQRLDAERIARQVQCARRAIPDRHREHALELRPHAGAPLLEAAQDALGVGVRAVAMPQGLELAAQGGMVEDLAVERDDVTAVLARHRLMAAGDVHDGGPAHAEAEVAIGEPALVVGPAVNDGVAHRADRALGHGSTAACVPARDATHVSDAPPWG